MAKKQKTAMASRTKKSKQRGPLSAAIKWSLLSMTLFISGSFGLWYAWDQTWFTETDSSSEQLLPIRLVEIQGELTQIDKEQILTVLRSLSRESSDDKQTINFLTTDLREVERELESTDWIYRVKVRKVWPDKLIIALDEQQAVAVWNETQLVNRYGELFQPEVITDSSLPNLTGPDHELRFLLDTFAELQSYFEAAELQLRELHLSDRRSWELKLVNGISLDVGRKDLHGRVKRFIELYPLLKSDDPAAIERVDLRYDTGLAVLRMNSETRQASL